MRPAERLCEISNAVPDRLLVEGGDSARNVPSGHLVYARQDTLMAVAMDAGRLAVGGATVPLEDEVYGAGEGTHYAFSDAGQMIYAPGNAQRFDRRIVWVDRMGHVEPTPLPPRPYTNPILSPDGLQAAVQVDENTMTIWLYDLTRGTFTPLTTAGAGSSQAPIWTPDGERIVYRGTRAGFRNLFWRRVDLSSGEERLTPLRANSSETPGSWSPDGRTLVLNQLNDATGDDISVMHLDGGRKLEPLVATQFSEENPRLSPDGRWLAFTSDGSGRREVYLRPFPLAGRTSQVSTDGGNEPVWSRNARELFYTNGDKMMSATVTTQPTLSVEAPRLLFEGRYAHSLTGSAAYDVSPDGRFFKVQPLAPDPPNNQINVVINWFEELKARVPAK